jgi:hypothetical protein
VSFIFADLIILPILNIYRKYYGWRMAAYIAATFYATMVLAGYAVELIFTLLHLVPQQRNARVIEAHISWNYTTWLNLAFLALTVVLLARFAKSGGSAMLRQMGGGPDDQAHHHEHHTADRQGLEHGEPMNRSEPHAGHRAGGHDHERHDHHGTRPTNSDPPRPAPRLSRQRTQLTMLLAQFLMGMGVNLIGVPSETSGDAKLVLLFQGEPVRERRHHSQI